MTKDFVDSFAKDWVSAWNAHNLEKILVHYADDFTIESPMAEKLCPWSGGTVKGKEEVRKYWTTGLQNNPQLNFELLDVMVGVNTIALFLCNNSSNRKSVEVMTFNSDRKVYRAVVCYSA